MGAAASDDDPLDWGVADVAVRVGAPIDSMLKLEEAFFPTRVNVIRNRGAAKSNGLLQYSLNGGVESRKFGACEVARTTAWTDAGSIERFVGVDVADSVQKFLVEQRGLNGGLAFSEEADKKIKVNAERFGAGACKARMCAILCGSDNGESSEAARIDEADLAS